MATIKNVPVFRQANAGRTQLNGLHGGHSGGRSPVPTTSAKRAGAASWCWYAGDVYGVRLAPWWGDAAEASSANELLGNG